VVGVGVSVPPQDDVENNSMMARAIITRYAQELLMFFILFMTPPDLLVGLPNNLRHLERPHLAHALFLPQARDDGHLPLIRSALCQLGS